MNEIAEDNKRKPKLTVEEQIEHLKSKGVTFELCDEGEASRILSEQDHYFRLAAYRVLFPKRVGGKHDGEYAELDFGQLVDLAGIDCAGSCCRSHSTWRTPPRQNSSRK